jgi:hypothetical protein
LPSKTKCLPFTQPGLSPKYFQNLDKKSIIDHTNTNKWLCESDKLLGVMKLKIMAKNTFTHQIIAINNPDISSKNRFLNYTVGHFLEYYINKIG